MRRVIRSIGAGLVILGAILMASCARAPGLNLPGAIVLGCAVAWGGLMAFAHRLRRK